MNSLIIWESNEFRYTVHTMHESVSYNKTKPRKNLETIDLEKSSKELIQIYKDKLAKRIQESFQ
jgi:hypothetical protein